MANAGAGDFPFPGAWPLDVELVPDVLGGVNAVATAPDAGAGVCEDFDADGVDVGDVGAGRPDSAGSLLSTVRLICESVVVVVSLWFSFAGAFTRLMSDCEAPGKAPEFGFLAPCKLSGA